MRWLFLLVFLFKTEIALASSFLQCTTLERIDVSNTPQQLTPPSGVFIAAELGAELEYSEDGAHWKPLAMPGTRLGWHLFQGADAGPIWFKSSLVPRARLALHQDCDFSASITAWIIQLQALAEAHDFTVTARGVENSELQALTNLASDELQIALVSHVAANQAFLNGEFEQAAGYFKSSKSLWRKLGWHTYEMAAALGENSMISRLDGFKKSSGIAQAYIDIGDNRTEFRYFRNRLKEELCQTQASDFQSTGKCLGPILYEYLDLGESGDYLNTLTKIAYAMPLDKRTEALRSGVLVDAIARTPKIPALRMSRGRFYLMGADAARRNSDFALSLQYLQLAKVEFQASTEESANWLVWIELLASDIHSQFGLHDQAMLGIQQALKLLDAKSQPARAASIFVQLGENFRRLGLTVQARHWIEVSRKINRALNQEERVSFADLALLELEDQPSPSEVQNLKLPATYAARVELLKARTLRDAGNFSLAKRSAERALALAGTPSEQADAAVLLSELPETYVDGEQILRDYLFDNARRADPMKHATLAYLNLRSGDRARRAWADRISQKSNVEKVFQTALISNPARFMTSLRKDKPRRLAPIKIAPDAMGFVVQLTESKPHDDGARFSALEVPSLREVQAEIPTGGKVLLLVPGERQTLALWISKNRAELKLLAGRQSLQQHIRALSMALSSPTTKKNEFVQAQHELSQALFAGSGGQSAPSMLWVVADELSSAIPFSALYWPGTDTPLVLGTEVSYITGLLVGTSGRPVKKMTTTAFFAPNYEGAITTLDFAKVEFERISVELNNVPQTYFGAAASRRQFQQLLQTGGAWIHVSAHGHADPGNLGNAGLWLSSETVPEPDFLSWMELSNLKARAELLVLNACQSAGVAESNRQASISFASAMSASGVEHVVAALWPVSDVAAATWIPAFYRNMPQHKSDASALALRNAQLSLYRSPHYQHPFYWASLVHFRRLDFAAR